jgi:hypothetical protein
MGHVISTFGPRGWTFRRPPRRALLVAGAVAGLLLWALTSWTWTVLAVALAVALILRVIGLLLPRQLRDRAGVLAVLAGLVAIVAQSSPWAVMLSAGLAGASLALIQLGTARGVALVASAVVATVGVVGLVLEYAAARVARDAEFAAAGDHARAQMLPDTPAETVAELMRRLGRTDGDDGACSLMFDEQGRRAFAAAHHVPDCPAAMRGARTQITDPVRYRERIELASITTRPAGALTDVDACRVRWRENALGEILTGTTVPARPAPGPPLGRLTLAPVPGGWVITDFRPC